MRESRIAEDEIHRVGAEVLRNMKTFELFWPRSYRFDFEQVNQISVYELTKYPWTSLVPKSHVEHDASDFSANGMSH